MQVSAYATQGATQDLKPFEITRRDMQPDDVLIDITHCGICHSDIHAARNEWGRSRYPFVPGHEIVGRVNAVGADAPGEPDVCADDQPDPDLQGGDAVRAGRHPPPDPARRLPGDRDVPAADHAMTDADPAFPTLPAPGLRHLCDLRIELFQNEQAAPMAEERRSAQTNLKIGGINHFAIEVTDLDATVASLQEKGVEIVSTPRDVPNGGGSRFAFIHDNEQMLVELIQPA